MIWCSSASVDGVGNWWDVSEAPEDANGKTSVACCHWSQGSCILVTLVGSLFGGKHRPCCDNQAGRGCQPRDLISTEQNRYTNPSADGCWMFSGLPGDKRLEYCEHETEHPDDCRDYQRQSSHQGKAPLCRLPLDPFLKLGSRRSITNQIMQKGKPVAPMAVHEVLGAILEHFVAFVNCT